MAEDTAHAGRLTPSVVILAGGQSQRLGRDKSLLVVDGEPLVARTVHRLAAFSDDLIIVTNDQERYASLALSARFVSDERRGVGALMGVYSGLKAARYSHALVAACDMPFLNLPLLHYMILLADGYDVVIPRLHGMLEPLHAIYHKRCLVHMERLLQQGRRTIVAFLPEVRVRHMEEHEVDRFDPLHLSFVNINTAEDWVRVQELLTQCQ